MHRLTRAGRIIAEEITRCGPIPFSRFMQIALYHPEHGYYRRSRERFGRAGDFYTAEQIQPVFGRLMRSLVHSLAAEVRIEPRELIVVELGAGRREMAEAFRDFEYVPVDVGSGEMPTAFSGVIFCNEFFDALPVDVVVSRKGRLVERRVSLGGDSFIWVDGPAASHDIALNLGPLEEETIREVPVEAVQWMERMGRSLSSGFAVIIDYGYTGADLRRFPEGTLMSYARHQAAADVLHAPGERDITSHVSFTDLKRHAARAGLETVVFETLRETLLRAGEPDGFASALAAANDRERLRHELQLKTLLFGMGETFRTLLLRKTAK